MKDPRILAVALEGIENVLKAGKEHFTVVSFFNYSLVNVGFR